MLLAPAFRPPALAGVAETPPPAPALADGHSRSTTVAPRPCRRSSQPSSASDSISLGHSVEVNPRSIAMRRTDGSSAPGASLPAHQQDPDAVDNLPVSRNVGIQINAQCKSVCHCLLYIYTVHLLSSPFRMRPKRRTASLLGWRRVSAICSSFTLTPERGS